MTADARRAALVQKMAKAMAVCEGYDANNIDMVGSFEDSASAALDLALEEAAMVADRYEIPMAETSASHIAAAIRALKEKQ